MTDKSVTVSVVDNIEIEDVRDTHFQELSANNCRDSEDAPIVSCTDAIQQLSDSIPVSSAADNLSAQSLVDPVCSQISTEMPLKDISPMLIKVPSLAEVVPDTLPTSSGVQELNSQLVVEGFSAVSSLQVDEFSSKSSRVDEKPSSSSKNDILSSVSVPPSPETYLSSQSQNTLSSEIITPGLLCELYAESYKILENEYCHPRDNDTPPSVVTENHCLEKVSDCLSSPSMSSTVSPVIENLACVNNNSDLESKQSKISSKKTEEDNTISLSPVFLRCKKRFLRRSSQADVTINLCGQKLVQLFNVDLNPPSEEEKDDEVITDESFHSRRPQVAMRGGGYGGRFRGAPKTYHQQRQSAKSDPEIVDTSFERFSEEAGLFCDQPSTIIHLKISDPELSDDSEGSNVKKSAVVSSKISAANKCSKSIDYPNESSKSAISSKSNTVSKRKSLNKSTEKSVSKGRSMQALDDLHSHSVADQEILKYANNKTHAQKPSSDDMEDDNDAKNVKVSQKARIAEKKDRSFAKNVRNKVDNKESNLPTKDAKNIKKDVKQICSMDNENQFLVGGKSKKGYESSPTMSSGTEMKSTDSVSVKDPKIFKHHETLQNFEIHNQIQRLKKGTELRGPGRPAKGSERNPGKGNAETSRDAGNNSKKTAAGLTKGSKKGGIIAGSLTGLKRKIESNAPPGPASFKRRRLELATLKAVLGPASFKAKLHSSDITLVAPFGLKDRQAATAFVCQSHQNYYEGWKVLRLTAEPPVKETIRADVQWEELEDCEPIGRELLTLWMSTEEEIEEMCNQVKKESEHRRTEHIVPLVMSLTSDQIESNYERVAEDMRTYDITEADSSEQDDDYDEEDDEEKEQEQEKKEIHEQREKSVEECGSVDEKHDELEEEDVKHGGVKQKGRAQSEEKQKRQDEERMIEHPIQQEHNENKRIGHERRSRKYEEQEKENKEDEEELKRNEENEEEESKEDEQEGKHNKEIQKQSKEDDEGQREEIDVEEQQQQTKNDKSRDNEEQDEEMSDGEQQNKKNNKEQEDDKYEDSNNLSNVDASKQLSDVPAATLDALSTEPASRSSYRALGPSRDNAEHSEGSKSESDHDDHKEILRETDVRSDDNPAVLTPTRMTKEKRGTKINEKKSTKKRKSCEINGSLEDERGKDGGMEGDDERGRSELGEEGDVEDRLTDERLDEGRSKFTKNPSKGILQYTKLKEIGSIKSSKKDNASITSLNVFKENREKDIASTKKYDLDEQNFSGNESSDSMTRIGKSKVLKLLNESRPVQDKLSTKSSSNHQQSSEKQQRRVSTSAPRPRGRPPKDKTAKHQGRLPKDKKTEEHEGTLLMKSTEVHRSKPPKDKFDEYRGRPHKDKTEEHRGRPAKDKTEEYRTRPVAKFNNFSVMQIMCTSRRGGRGGATQSSGRGRKNSKTVHISKIDSKKDKFIAKISTKSHVGLPRKNEHSTSEPYQKHSNGHSSKSSVKSVKKTEGVKKSKTSETAIPRPTETVNKPEVFQDTGMKYSRYTDKNIFDSYSEHLQRFTWSDDEVSLTDKRVEQGEMNTISNEKFASFSSPVIDLSSADEERLTEKDDEPVCDPAETRLINDELNDSDDQGDVNELYISPFDTIDMMPPIVTVFEGPLREVGGISPPALHSDSTASASLGFVEGSDSNQNVTTLSPRINEVDCTTNERLYEGDRTGE